MAKRRFTKYPSIMAASNTSSKYNLIYTTKNDLKSLGSALTFEGFAVDDDNFDALVEWLDSHGCTMTSNNFYITKGDVMNRYCKLTGDNAYPDDLNIVSIALEDLQGLNNIIMARFQIGGRWLDDVIDNNIWHEKEKRRRER